MDEQEFLALLQDLLKPQTEQVKAATATLNKKYYTSPSSLTALLHILTNHGDSGLRQLAAVEARKLVSKHWSSVPAGEKPAIRNKLLQASLNEETVLTRHSIARIIAAVAKLDLDQKEWTELPGLLQQAAGSPEARHREVAVFIIYTLLEELGDFFMEVMDKLFTIFSATLQDKDSVEVRTNTMLALSRIAMLLDTDEDQESVKAFQNLIPGMVSVLKGTIESGDEDHAMQSFEVFQTLLGCDSVLLQTHFGDLVKFMMEIAGQTSIDDGNRSQALSFLHQCVKYRRLKVQSLRIGEEMTLKALQIVTELDPEDDPEDDDVNAPRSALGLLDTLAASLPPSQVLVPLLKAIGPYCTSENAQYRQAGMLALGMSVEGAPDFVALQLKEILPMVLHLLEDPDVRVRAATLHCIARLADDLADEMGQYHEQLVPALVKSLDAAAANLRVDSTADISMKVMRSNCAAVESLIEGVEAEAAAKYVVDLAPRFSRIMDLDDTKTKMAAVGALGSVASASEDAFEPYFEQTMQKLGQYVGLKDSQEELDLRGAVCDSVGKIAFAVGAEKFDKFVGPLMQASEEALHLDHPRLRETSYILWSTMSKVYEEKFEPYLDGVVKGLHACLEQDEKELEVVLGEEAKDLLGQEVTIAGKKVKVAEATADDEDVLDIEDLGDEDDWDDIDGVTAVAMEKEIALEVVGDVLSHAKRKYLPYLRKSVDIILPLTEHPYEGVRKSAISSLWRAYACLWEIAEADGMAHWQPGVPLKISPTADLAELGEMVMKVTLTTWAEELDRSTVTDINRDLSATMKLCGPACLIAKEGPVIGTLAETILTILTKDHPCQKDLGDEGLGDELPEETSEYDWLVIETACDVLVALSAALGSDFAQLWKMFEKPVLKYASGQESSERSTAVGSIADCIGNMGAAVTPFTPSLLKILLHRLSDEDPDTKANAAYGIGLLCWTSESPEIVKNYSTILSKLEPMLHDQQNGRVLDNAAGCVSRMIEKHPTKVPLNDVLPKLVELLPLREDFEENAPVYSMIVKLYQSGSPITPSLTPAMKSVLSKVLGPPDEQLEPDTREQLLQLVEHIKQQE